MNKKVLKTLEFYKIINKASGYAASKEASRLISGIRPSDDIETIRKDLSEVSCAIDRIGRIGEPAFRGITPVSDSVERLHVKASLDMGELLDIAYIIETAGNIKEYAKESISEGRKDALSSYFDELVAVVSLSSEIKRCILSPSDMADDASATLSLIRKKIGEMDSKVHGELNSILNKGENQSYLTSSSFTLRDGRYCLPVRAEHKKHFPGVVHDTSGTGSTLFIEPESVIRLNNEYQELLLDEKKEIEKILASLSEIAAEYADDILKDHDVLVKLDFIFAKAKYSRDIKAKIPEITSDGKTILISARHPLLDKKTAKPVDIRLGDDFDLLVVTGPNTGGKTVSLKTFGLLTLMAMSGLPIPAENGSRVAVY